MDGEEDVKLHGFWASYFAIKVIWALKLKGVKYEYLEEDLANKSDLLLEYNPVYKKVPVFLHAGKPVLDSTVILEYIEDTWPLGHALFPQDALDRAAARFWISFGIEKSSIFYSFMGAREEQKEEAAKQVFEFLKIIEEQSLGSKKFFGGESINAVDITFGWLAGWFECAEEVVGVKIVEPNKLPRLHSWLQNFKQIPTINEALPDPEKLMEYLTKIRATMLAPVV